MRKVSLFTITVLFMVLVTGSLFSPTASWAQESLAEQLTAIKDRLQVLEDRLALSQVPPYKLEEVEGFYVREGEGNWSGIISISEPGLRIFVVEFAQPNCSSTVKLFHQGGTADTRIMYSCTSTSGGDVPRGGAVLDFDDFREDFSSSKGNFPLGDYAIQVDADIPWKITVLTNPQD